MINVRQLAAFLGAAVLLAALPGTAHAASPTFAEATTIGTHNAYEKAKYGYFAQALDSGASLLEIDVYTDIISHRWRVGHNNPFSNDNNCEKAKAPEDLYSTSLNQDLGSCLDNVSAWSQKHPDHPPIVFKVEMKLGFNDKLNLGPDEFDSLVLQKLGDSVYKPADLLSGTFSSLDAAAKANAWPSRDSLRGKFLFEVIPGTVERENPFDHYWTDREYGDHLRDLYSAGRISQASSFPSVLGPEDGDPRINRYDASIRPWFVFFDGDAATYVNNEYNTSFYSANHYILIMTGADRIAPVISSTNPSNAEVVTRLALLAQQHASIITSDWSPKDASILSLTADRS
ncbi:phosphatidylinositol-specific phospholipase C domain-containing protein [Streptomyces sp. NPDC093509]|uniref:phosphatidylinositol-specific phospholipase C domain-containing protein n=1 Tax=Streptomyces sp. NPDC093509 TaxID=3154982 RepID=UPI00344CC306